MVSILLGSHGYFAKEALASAEMIVGKQENVGVFSLEEQMDLEMIVEEARNQFDMLEKSNGVLILTDILGGTPSNVAMIIQRKNPNTNVLTGFNLPIIIEALLNREQNLEQLVTYLVEAFPSTLQNITK
ncbi:PTS sugar transporter subunit IIA [Enterococcus saccharolyticus]|uniref:PTS EIIA type-4 domain-containing protein n=1 Tax=Candidatus Enterococcus willemsii TaxID=1857215 RepID=A0ABQ6Z0I7_9ENTE|nr:MULTISPECIES: PTS sugar transporter subunit IIA [Enterococcus]KAF1304533.1 hypothetical protein BAU17_10035 [Enterococcus sp. CU12B]MCD5001266.1 PTS sugar transporter subunit IIA [Enterococcus saccharolyticus]